MLKHDWNLVVKALDRADELASFKRRAARFGLPPHGWWAIPFLRSEAINLAILVLAEVEWKQGATYEEGIAGALADLGIEDDSDRATSPAFSVLTKWNSWKREAAQIPEPPPPLTFNFSGPAEAPKKIIDAPPWATSHVAPVPGSRSPEK